MAEEPRASGSPRSKLSAAAHDHRSHGTHSTDLPLLLSADETADILRTTRIAVYALAARRQLPGVVRIGRRLLVRSAELVEWLDQKSAPSRENQR